MRRGAGRYTDYYFNPNQTQFYHNPEYGQTFYARPNMYAAPQTWTNTYYYGAGATAQASTTNTQQQQHYNYRAAAPVTGSNSRRRGYFASRPQRVIVSAEDLETQRGAMIEELQNNKYDCMVCCDTVKRDHSVWSCKMCFHIFHFKCVVGWAKESIQDNIWRCPSCQNENDKIPTGYYCFCGKVRNPPVVWSNIPHSCGEMCGLTRAAHCPHVCNTFCHPGKCPQCQVYVSKICHCGKDSKMMKCTAEIPTCSNICGDDLDCGRHKCEDTCHEAPCKPCAVVETIGCFCGADSKEIGCSEFSVVNARQSFSCSKICDKLLSCGHHRCMDVCHSSECTACQFGVDVVTHCPCGKRSLVEIMDETIAAAVGGDEEDRGGAEDKAEKGVVRLPRTSCLDDIPSCGEICGKELKCGPLEDRHKCAAVCHMGECPPCSLSSVVVCRCSRQSKKMPCLDATKFTDDNPFICDIPCNRKMQCNRHKCLERCCALFAKKSVPHMCTKVCGKKLSCGSHRCEEVCHLGNCPRCPNVSFNELTCHCGEAVQFPPIQCGTQPPVCHRPCTRQHDCDHTVGHNCHCEETCPPCTVLTTKWCMCGRVKRANVLCYIKNVACGIVCDKELPCGLHRCLRFCHEDDCVGGEIECKQACTIPRLDCGHPCAAPCHGQTPCPPSLCNATNVIHCPCGRRSGKAPCLVSPNSAAFSKDSLIKIMKTNIYAGQSIDLVNSGGGGVGGGSTKQQLQCDDVCRMMERNKGFASALNIENADIEAKFGPTIYCEFLRIMVKSEAGFIEEIESALTNLVNLAKTSRQASRSYSFRSMGDKHRKAIHMLSEHYGCTTSSYDNEPNRNVVATAFKDSCRLPTLSLSQCGKEGIGPPPTGTSNAANNTNRKSGMARDGSGRTNGGSNGGAGAISNGIGGAMTAAGGSTSAIIDGSGDVTTENNCWFQAKNKTTKSATAAAAAVAINNGPDMKLSNKYTSLGSVGRLSSSNTNTVVGGGNGGMRMPSSGSGSNLTALSSLSISSKASAAGGPSTAAASSTKAGPKKSKPKIDYFEMTEWSD